MRYSLFVFLLFIVLFSSCKNSIEEKKPPAVDEKITETDPHSFSNPFDFKPENLKLDLEVDFENRIISGSARWKVNPKEGVDSAVFDIYDLQIDSIVFADRSTASFKIGNPDPVLGSPLVVDLKPDSEELTIYYRTGEAATALQWLDPGQTFGKKHPYLFTQGQSIYTRSWVPVPDSPGYRFSYEAKVKVPENLLAVMSAENPQEKNEDGIYYFKMEQKIPAYLMALAVGDISFQAVDGRTGVYAEPAMLKSAHAELEGLGDMVKTAESLYGPYRWDRYDVLILPPGFPYGGMENPRLTFATPTILAGDKSLLNLIAHELAHSWSGNLVTNSTWDDFWLNEGFTAYIERRITEAERGKEYAAMLWNLAEEKVDEAVSRLGETSKDTWLKLDLKNRDPDQGMTRIPYDKGSAFLLLIEQTVGREKWDEFLKEYFDVHAFKPMTTEKFLDYLNENLLKENEAWKNSIDVDAWVYGPGKPENYPHLENKRFENVAGQAAAFLDGGSAKEMKTESWSTHEWLYFFGQVNGKLTADQMNELDKEYNTTRSSNSEIANAWFLQALKADYSAAFPTMKDFLTVTGRGKFLAPLYEEMLKTEKGRKMATEIYKEARPNYHPIVQRGVDAMFEAE